MDFNKILSIPSGLHLLKIRSEVEKGTEHSGADFELCLKVYNEIMAAQGKPAKTRTGCRGGCLHTINQILKNWLKLYDDNLRNPIATTSKTTDPEVKILKPKDLTPKDSFEGWSQKDLIAALKTKIGEDKYKALKLGAMPSKEKLIAALNA